MYGFDRQNEAYFEALGPVRLPVTGSLAGNAFISFSSSSSSSASL